MNSNSKRYGMLRADIMSIAIMIVFIILAYLTDSLINIIPGKPGIVLTGLIMSGVPAIIWLGLFYRKDSEEPEPRSLVLKVFLLGAIVYEGVGDLILSKLFKVDAWLYGSSPAIQLIGGFLIVGIVQEFLKYASVRFSVYSLDEYEGPTDGIIYATAAGIGFATAMNIRFVIESGGVDLGLGAVHITLTVLAQAGFSGIVGYFMGRLKTSKTPLWWMPCGLILAAASNSLFIFIRANLISGTLGQTRLWLGIIVSVLFTGGISIVLSRLISKENEILRQGGES